MDFMESLQLEHMTLQEHFGLLFPGRICFALGRGGEAAETEKLDNRDK